MKIAIVGGGIGGLATALAMTQAGFAVAVYERSAQLLDFGAGITLAPNATRVLYHLGLGEMLEETAVTPPQTEYRHYRTGQVIYRMMTKDFRALYGAPYMRLHRWDLQRAMLTRLAQAAPGALQLGANVEGLESHDSHVTLDRLLNELVICGTVNEVVDQILALREQVGDFGEIVYAGMDLVDPDLGRRSMELMAHEVMPRVNAALKLGAETNAVAVA